MATSSLTSHCCHCKVETAELRNGWRLLGGGFSKLCEACCSAYEKDTFCESFHLDSDGWRDCRICGKLIHCGCRMSFHIYETLDFGGIACVTCSRESVVSEPNQYPSLTATSEVSRDLRNSSGAEYSPDAGEVMLASIAGIGVSPDNSMHPFLPNETALRLVSSGPSSPTAPFGEPNRNKTGTHLDPVVGCQRSSCNVSVHRVSPNETALQSISPGQPSPGAQFFGQTKSAAETPFDVGNQRASSDFSIRHHRTLSNEIAVGSISIGKPHGVSSPAAQSYIQNKNEADKPFYLFVESEIASPDFSSSRLLPNKTTLESVSCGQPSSAVRFYEQNNTGAEAPIFPSIGNEGPLSDCSIHNMLPDETSLKSVSPEEPSLIRTHGAQSYIPNKSGEEKPLFPFVGNESVSSGFSVQSMLPNEAPLQAVPYIQPIQILYPMSHFSDPEKTVATTPSIPVVVSTETSIHSPLRSETNFQSAFHGAPSQVPPPVAQIAEQNRSPSIGEATALVPFVRNQISQGNTTAKSTLRRLFEKSLSPSDAERRLARLVLPKLCAQVYFPAILEGQQQPIIIQDSMGRDWRFCYRSWRNGRSRMYVLDGIKSYMDLMDWKAGDIVTFHRLEPEGKLVIGTKKVPSDSATSKVCDS